MEDLVDKGLVHHLGVSNFNSTQLSELVAGARAVKPVMLQIETHPLLNNASLIEHARARGLAVTAYSPLGSPDRPWASLERQAAADDDTNGAAPTSTDLLGDTTVGAIAAARSSFCAGASDAVTPAQVLVRYAVQRGLAVVPKSVTPGRIRENLDVHGFALTDDEMARLDGMDRGWRACVPLAPDGSGPRDAAHTFFPFATKWYYEASPAAPAWEV